MLDGIPGWKTRACGLSKVALASARTSRLGRRADGSEIEKFPFGFMIPHMGYGMEGRRSDRWAKRDS
jgi:hypothetical protein